MMKTRTLQHWLICLLFLIFTFLAYQPVSAQSLVNPAIGTKLLTQARSFWIHFRNYYKSTHNEILRAVHAYNQDEPPIQEIQQELTPPPSEINVIIYVFWGDGCPHCEIARPAIKSFAKRFDNVEVREYEVWYHPENQELLISMSAQLGFEPHVVPTIIIGEKYWEGFAESLLPEMENAILTCVKTGCQDLEAKITPVHTPTITSTAAANSIDIAQVQTGEFTPTVTASSSPSNASTNDGLPADQLQQALSDNQPTLAFSTQTTVINALR